MCDKHHSEMKCLSANQYGAVCYKQHKLILDFNSWQKLVSVTQCSMQLQNIYDLLSHQATDIDVFVHKQTGQQTNETLYG